MALSLYETVFEARKEERVCGSCIHFDICECEFLTADVKENDQPCDGYAKKEIESLYNNMFGKEV